MPAIASIEDLKAAQKEDFGIYAMRYALCALRSAFDTDTDHAVLGPSELRGSRITVLMLKGEGD